jgi:hypothetical protein
MWWQGLEVVGNCGGAVLPLVILLLPGICVRPAACSCPASTSCPPSTQLIVLCAALYAGGGGSGAGDVPCAISPCAINVCAVKVGVTLEVAARSGGSGKVWRWWEALDAVTSKVWRQR